MNTMAIALIIVLMLGVGTYIGVSNLAQQYMVAPNGSNANQYACVPEAANIRVGQSVKFSGSIPEGTPYYWSAPDATSSSFIASGPLTAQYNRAGTKTAYLFYVANDRWYRTTCSVEVK